MGNCVNVQRFHNTTGHTAYVTIAVSYPEFHHDGRHHHARSETYKVLHWMLHAFKYLAIDD